MSEWLAYLRRCEACRFGEHEDCTGGIDWCPCIECVAPLVVLLPHPRLEPPTT